LGIYLLLRNQQTLFTDQSEKVSFVIPDAIKGEVVDKLAALLLVVVESKREPQKEKECLHV
jgi:hypothetical protein